MWILIDICIRRWDWYRHQGSNKLEEIKLVMKSHRVGDKLEHFVGLFGICWGEENKVMFTNSEEPSLLIKMLNCYFHMLTSPDKISSVLMKYWIWAKLFNDHDVYNIGHNLYSRVPIRIFRCGLTFGVYHGFCCFWCRQIVEQPIQIVQLNGCLVRMLCWHYSSIDRVIRNSE